jgi:hypothetical protein
MKQIIRIVFFIYLLLISTVVFLNLKGDVTFGHGLGDLYFLITIIIVTVILLFFFIKMVKSNYVNAIVIYFFLSFLLLIIVLLCLKLTVLRGSEYPWNGSFFIA